MPYEDHYFYLKPENLNVKIWRYIDFTKFIWILEHKSLWFTRADHLCDPFEGTLSRRSLYLEGVEPTQSAEYDRNVKIIRDSYKKWKHWVVVNCWHRNEYESAAMWNLYIDSDCGIAIQSTWDKLTKSFHLSPEKVWVTVVRYVDYDNVKMYADYPPTVFSYKRISFQHEREVRALIDSHLGKKVPLEQEPDYTGICIPVDLDLLIERIFVSPQLDEWKYKIVKKVAAKYGISKEIIERSRLDAVPLKTYAHYMSIVS